MCGPEASSPVSPLPSISPTLQRHQRVLLQKGPVFRFNVINHRLGNKYRCCVCSSTVSQVPEESLPLSAFS